jgi:DHA1 family inner membrane transport protein
MLLAGAGPIRDWHAHWGFLPFYGPIMVALFLAGLGISVYNPAIQAYIGERVPSHRRGMAVGLIETCWAGSSLVGIPLVGLLIDRFVSRAPFFVLGALGLVSMVGLGLLIPGNRDGSKTSRALQSSHYGF